MWEKNALTVEEFGGYVNWKERFYECLVCGEPIYECDWSEQELEDYVCPVCELEVEEEG